MPVQSAAPAAPAPGFQVTLAPAIDRTSLLARARAETTRNVGKEFEAVTLTTFVQHILPSEDSIVWGGEAGRLWRGVFAEHLAAEVARGGGIGIADLINSSLDQQNGERS